MLIYPSNVDLFWWHGGIVGVCSSFTYEVIVVDDGSTDRTAAEVKRWVAQLGTDAVRLLTLSENQGKGAAVGKVTLDVCIERGWGGALGKVAVDAYGKRAVFFWRGESFLALCDQLSGMDLTKKTRKL